MIEKAGLEIFYNISLFRKVIPMKYNESGCILRKT
jgi:hypothetical protein